VLGTSLHTIFAFSPVKQMGTDWHDSAHSMGLEDLEHIVPCHISEDQICSFTPSVLAKNVDVPNVCTTAEGGARVIVA